MELMTDVEHTSSHEVIMKSVSIVYNGGMAKRVEVKTELTVEALQKKYRKAKDLAERTHWHILWLVKEGHRPREVAEPLGYTTGWVRAIVRPWNEAGRQGIIDHLGALPGRSRCSRPAI